MASASSVPRATIGEWYQDIHENLYFEVVAIDNPSGSISIQYLDGEVGDIDKESWKEMALLQASPPEDACIAFEMSIPDDWNHEPGLTPWSWNDPLSLIEPELFQGSEEF